MKLALVLFFFPSKNILRVVSVTSLAPISESIIGAHTTKNTNTLAVAHASYLTSIVGWPFVHNEVLAIHVRCGMTVSATCVPGPLASEAWGARKGRWGSPIMYETSSVEGR